MQTVTAVAALHLCSGGLDARHDGGARDAAASLPIADADGVSCACHHPGAAGQSGRGDLALRITGAEAVVQTGVGAKEQKPLSATDHL